MPKPFKGLHWFRGSPFSLHRQSEVEAGMFGQMVCELACRGQGIEEAMQAYVRYIIICFWWDPYKFISSFNLYILYYFKAKCALRQRWKSFSQYTSSAWNIFRSVHIIYSPHSERQWQVDKKDQILLEYGVTSLSEILSRIYLKYRALPYYLFHYKRMRHVFLLC